MGKRIFLVLLFWGGMVAFLGAQEKIRGNYEVLNGSPQKHSLETVVFEEFINFACPHCNNFRLLSEELREKYKDRVEFVDIPITFRGQSEAPLRLYYAGQSLGKGEEVKKAIFEAKFVHGVDVFDPGIINYLARSLGMGEAYQQAQNDPQITEMIAQGKEKTARYGVEGTPTIVLANTLKMKIGGSMEDFTQQLPETLDDLLKQ